jgi:hypothetical protein
MNTITSQKHYNKYAGLRLSDSFATAILYPLTPSSKPNLAKTSIPVNYLVAVPAFVVALMQNLDYNLVASVKQ